MAKRRMVSNAVVDSDCFMELSLQAQALYFHLCLSADDDGFVGGVRSAARKIGADPACIGELEAAGFVISFPSGCLVIVHWLTHNAIRLDRYAETVYQAEKAQLMEVNRTYVLADGSQAATDRQPDGNQMATKWQPDGNQMATKWQPNGNQVATKWQPNGNQMATQYNITKDNPTQEKKTEENGAKAPCPPEADDVRAGEAAEILEYLNGKTGAGFRLNSKKSRALIRARLKEGFTAADFRTVIDTKTADWLHTEMAVYLRPETLFGPKFEGYLNEGRMKKNAAADGADPVRISSRYDL